MTHAWRHDTRLFNGPNDCLTNPRHPEADVLIRVSAEACSVCLDALRLSLLAVQPGASPPEDAADTDFVSMANSIGGAMISLSYLIADPFLYHRCVLSTCHKPCADS